MPTRFNSRTSSNARKGGLQQCTLSLLTAAMLLAGVQAAPVLAATDEQRAQIGKSTRLNSSHYQQSRMPSSA